MPQQLLLRAPRDAHAHAHSAHRADLWSSPPGPLRLSAAPPTRPPLLPQTDVCVAYEFSRDKSICEIHTTQINHVLPVSGSVCMAKDPRTMYANAKLGAMQASATVAKYTGSAAASAAATAPASASAATAASPNARA
mmetsp:Transcript_19978/g.67553  ORF Transcript_19978/g.67553 Transcript_19978/m.67553 type:complete len:137 (-) Transcript_19978:29-439(-)